MAVCCGFCAYFVCIDCSIAFIIGGVAGRYNQMPLVRKIKNYPPPKKKKLTISVSACLCIIEFKILFMYSLYRTQEITDAIFQLMGLRQTAIQSTILVILEIKLPQFKSLQ